LLEDLELLLKILDGKNALNGAGIGPLLASQESQQLSAELGSFKLKSPVLSHVDLILDNK
jgi:hypothetical protein